ncbi:hypothetical protein L2E82_23114 [Cichorium intybus]|uniref:Uncharacterized protein n=1 Tax=Cichorium intybus TaxID=13427 RepID=A0ACB9DZY1_CICIN|nr:hypothetical protein L2E82_23114 [Cichorium intybus]
MISEGNTSNIDSRTYDLKSEDANGCSDLALSVVDKLPEPDKSCVTIASDTSDSEDSNLLLAKSKIDLKKGPIEINNKKENLNSMDADGVRLSQETTVAIVFYSIDDNSRKD